MVEIEYTDKILKFKIDDHNQHKQQILEECKKSKFYSISSDINQRIKTTDFSENQRESLPLLFKKHIVSLFKTNFKSL